MGFGGLLVSPSQGREFRAPQPGLASGSGRGCAQIWLVLERFCVWWMGSLCLTGFRVLVLGLGGLMFAVWCSVVRLRTVECLYR